MARILVIECDDLEVPDVVSRLNATVAARAASDVLADIERSTGPVVPVFKPPAAAATTDEGWYRDGDALVLVAQAPTAVATARECLDGTWQWEVPGRAAGFAEDRDGALKRVSWVRSWPAEEVEARAAALLYGDERLAFAASPPPAGLAGMQGRSNYELFEWRTPREGGGFATMTPATPLGAVAPTAVDQSVIETPAINESVPVPEAPVGSASVGGEGQQDVPEPAPSSQPTAAPSAAPIAGASWVERIRAVEDPRSPKADPLVVGAGAFFEMIRIWYFNYGSKDANQPDRIGALMGAFAGYGPAVGKFIRERGGLAGACTTALMQQNLCPPEEAVRVGKQLAVNIVQVATTQALPLDRLLERSLLLNQTPLNDATPAFGSTADSSIDFDTNRPTAPQGL